MSASILDPAAPLFNPHVPTLADIPLGARETLPHHYNFLLMGHIVKIAVPGAPTTNTSSSTPPKPKVVWKTYPLRLLQHVSPVIATAMQDHPSQTPTGLILHLDNTIPHPAIHEILSWLLRCATAGNYLPGMSYDIEHYAFTKYGRMLEVANFLIGYDYTNTGLLGELCAELRFKLTRIAQRQVHSHDIIEIYKNTPPNHPLRAMACESVARAVAEMRLRRFWQYTQFRASCAEFDRDLTAWFEELGVDVHEIEQGEGEEQVG